MKERKKTETINQTVKPGKKLPPPTLGPHMKERNGNKPDIEIKTINIIIFREKYIANIKRCEINNPPTEIKIFIFICFENVIKMRNASRVCVWGRRLLCL